MIRPPPGAPFSPWIWGQADWPQLTFDASASAPDLAQAHRLHGMVEGKLAAIGLHHREAVLLDTFSSEVVATAEIEGEHLPLASVRSSVMRKLGITEQGPRDRRVDGLVDVMDDACTGFAEPLDEDRLCRWQSALFPGGLSGLQRIAVGRYREHPEPMQIVSGRPGREVVHYEAPPSSEVPTQMQAFLAWFARTAPRAECATSDTLVAGAYGTGMQTIDGIARAAIAHLWFETIHPFEDGNGRIGRAIIDLVVAQHLRHSTRLFSLSRRLLKVRTAYYDALNQAQRGGCDVTSWVRWFAQQWAAACIDTDALIDQALTKRHFWETHAHADLNERQRKVLQRLLDAGDGGFLGGMTAEKYMKLTGVSKATATRDLSQLLAAGQIRSQGAGRGIRYEINVPEWRHEAGSG